MECPGADRILNITNKYGEDPATIADKHGHREIKEIIHKLSQKVNAKASDPQERIELEQEDVYVDMVINAAQHGEESIDDIMNENQNNVLEEGLSVQSMQDYKEEEEEESLFHFQEDSFSEELNVNDDYCFSFPAGCESGPFEKENEYKILQDQQGCQDKDDQVYLDDSAYEDLENKYKKDVHPQRSELAVENIYTSMQQSTISEESIMMYNESFAVTICSSESAPQTFQEAMNEENILNLTEEKEKQREQQGTFSPYSPLPPEPSFIEEEEEDDNDDDNVSHIAQGAEEECNEHASWCEQECEQREEETNDDNEEQYIAATDDSLYIIFEAASKSQREQKSFKWADPLPDKPPLHSDDNPSFIAEEKGEENNKEYAFSEHICELDEGGNDNAEPNITATTDDDLYIVFEPMNKEPQRRQQSPDLSLPAAEEYGLSSFAQASQSTDQNIWLDEYTDEMEYIYFEEDPYSLVYNDDESLYIELPMESTEEPKRERKSFIIHRAPAPAPRVDVPAIENEPSYISQVFKQKQEDRTIYGTGMPQGLQKKDEDKNVYGLPQRFQQREQEKKMCATVLPKNKDKQQANYEDYSISQQCVPSGQEELILLQEKVKCGVMSMDEALEKFQQWQNEKSELDRLQKEKLRQLRDSIIGDKIEDDRLYDKITIVHQPKVSDAHMKRSHGALDNSIYQTPFIPSTPHTAVKKDNYIPFKHHPK
uniref:B cell scaffold protein with ankyrin repeats 1 n=1 Tax=Xenopus tropicalis TaxID=8364 RepID=A0A6I8RB62_XENTR